MPQSTSITVISRRLRKQVAIESEVTRVTFRTVSYIALDSRTERKNKARRR
jgi:hypothetical protein